MFVYLSNGVLQHSIPEMTYSVFGGTLNPTHSLTHSLTVVQHEFARSAKEVWQRHWAPHQSRALVHTAAVPGSEAYETMQRSACRY